MTRLQTVLVTVYEGRHFKPLKDSLVYIQCRFNNEILTTDPVSLDKTPIWDTELAWVKLVVTAQDIESKVLSFLKSQRTCLKLIVFSIDSANQRNALGHVRIFFNS